MCYSPVVINGFPPKAYYKNWTKLVQIMHICLQHCVPVDKILDVRQAMVEFLEEYQELYGIHNMTYNSHILLHMVDHVKEWRPFWGFSAFPFQPINGKLVRFVNGTRYAHTQIVEKFCILQSLPQILHATLHWQNEGVTLFIKSLLRDYGLRKVVSRSGTVLLYGKGRQEGGTV